MWAIDNNLYPEDFGGRPGDDSDDQGSMPRRGEYRPGAYGGDAMPGMWSLAGSMTLGFFSCDWSLVLFIHALRHLGSAAGAHFSTAPFIGAAVAILALEEPFTLVFAGALLLMVLARGWC